MPGMGCTWFLPRLVGEARAKELLLSKRRLNGREAAEFGLVNRAVPAGQVLFTALEMARAAADCKPGMIDRIKRGIAAGTSGTLVEAIASERRLSAENKQ